MDAIVETALASLSDPAHLVGHFTYVLMTLSVLMRSMAWLRALAVAAGLSKIVYRAFFVLDPVSVVWETLFVVINVVQLLILWWEKRPPSFTPEEQHFVQTVAPQLPGRVARALVRAGAWGDVAPGTLLTREGERIAALVFISRGAVRIERDGRQVGTCQRGDFLGEMTYVSGKPATATAIAGEDLRVLRFDRRRLEIVQRARPVLRMAMQASFNRNLITKLQRSNEAIPQAS